MASPKTPQEARAFFEGLSPSTIRLGLESMSRAVQALGHPERSAPTLHVAGTNGKGSTCAFAASMLRAEGYRVGMYTSPHLVKVNERIQVDGEPISDDRLGWRTLEVLERCPEAAELTFFEFGTLLAFWHFAQEKVDAVVLETGLGGRLDATSVCSPQVTAIAPVAFDHMEYLGNTLEAIAGEKAGIFKRGVPVALGQQLPEAQAVLEHRAAQLTAQVHLLGRDFGWSKESAPRSYRGLDLSVPEVRLGLPGPHQWQNAALAVASLELLSRTSGLRLSPEGIRRGLLAARWPGRLEEVAHHPTVVVDGAHNPHGAAALSEALKQLYTGRPIHLVFGALADKDVASMGKLLFQQASSLHLAPVDSSRTESPLRLKELALALGIQSEVYPAMNLALEAAKKRAGPEGVVVCAGSLYLVGQVKSYLTKHAD